MTDPVDQAAARPAAAQGRAPLVGADLQRARRRRRRAGGRGARRRLDRRLLVHGVLARRGGAGAVGMAAARSAASASGRGIAVGALTLVAVAPLALHGAEVLDAGGAWRSAPSRPAPPADGAAAPVWTGAGVFYAAAILARADLAAREPRLRARRDPLAVRGRVGRRHHSPISAGG